MDRIGVCGRCLKTLCHIGRIECENKDDGPDYSLLKTIDEIRGIGKENVIWKMVWKHEPVADDWSIIEVKGGLFDLACKEL